MRHSAAVSPSTVRALLVEQRAGKERRSHRLLAVAAMADTDVDRLALGLEPDRAAQASAFPDHDNSRPSVYHRAALRRLEG